MKIILFTLLTGFCALLAAAEITLAENGKSNAAIVIPAKAKPIVRFAAQELAEHLKLMTGAKFPVGVKPGPGVNFYLGFGNAKGFESDEFVIDVRGNRIDIYGHDTAKPVKLFNYYYDNTEKGTLCGVHYFLDSLGVRWLAPGEHGVHIPHLKTLRIPERQLRFKPFFQCRKVNDGYDFFKKHPDAKHYAKNTDDVYLWAIRNHATPRSSIFQGSHSEMHLKLFENPEWLAHPTAHQLMKNGKRNPHWSCWTDPFTKEIWMRAADGYFAGKSPAECGFPNLKGYLDSKWPYPFFAPEEFLIMAADLYSGNDGRCWCERCQQFRKEHPCKDDTEILWKVIADVARMVEKKYPGRYITTSCYPPMQSIPKLTEVPKNVRLRIQAGSPDSIYTPEKHAEKLKFIKSWSKIVDPKFLPLSVFQCAAGFGNALPGIMDTYPHLWADYIRDVKTFCSGIYAQPINLTHTQRNLDVYIFMRLMWNPDLDVEKELDEYFRLYYGPAAAPAKQLFALYENNWKRIFCEILSEKKIKVGLPIQSKTYFQKKIWSQVYTLEELKKIDGLMAEIIRLAPKGSVYAKRAGLLQKYIVELMKEERSYIMEKEERRQKIKLTAGSSAAADFPSDAEWSKAPEYQLISARRLSPKLKAVGSFRVLASGDQLFIRADLKEPKMSDSKTDPRHKSGNRDIWKDNCIELFFHAEKSKKFWHIMVNDNNAWSSRNKGKVLIRWEQMKGLKVKTRRKADGWTADITIPLKELKTDKTDLRFNLTRDRNVKGQAEECSTWSPLATSGNGHDPDNYGSMIFE